MQQKTYTDLLYKILSIIGYQNSKEKFVTDFDIVNRLDAAANIIDTYPQDIQNKIKACKNETELKQYLPEEDYKNEYIKVTRKTLDEFISAVAGVLTINQKQKIADLISTY